MAILKSDYSVSLCPFSKKRSKKKMNKELDNFFFICLLLHLTDNCTSVIKFTIKMKSLTYQSYFDFAQGNIYSWLHSTNSCLLISKLLVDQKMSITFIFMTRGFDDLTLTFSKTKLCDHDKKHW